MTKHPSDVKSDSVVSLNVRLTPNGNIQMEVAPPEGGATLKLETAERIKSAFERGRGYGVLHLGAAELATELPPSLAYWREFGKKFVSRVCHTLDPNDPLKIAIPEPDSDEIRNLIESAPPIQGAELISCELLQDIWSDMGEAIVAESLNYENGIEGFLKKCDSAWNAMGRVCFHLAENKHDRDYPFAFVATYVTKVSKRAKPQHKQLGHALKEFADEKDGRMLAVLLEPVARAANHSSFIQDLVEEGKIYQSLKWTSEQAHTFLQEVGLYDRAGIVVRMPDYWSARNKPKPVVTVSIGRDAPSVLGADSLLDYNLSVTLEDEPLSEKEINRILKSSEGLLFMKGKWIEVNPELIAQVLDHWQQIAEMTKDGVSFGEAMKAIAGAGLDNKLKLPEGDRREWSQVVAGKWLQSTLAKLHSPELEKGIQNNAGLNAELRPYQKEGVQWLTGLRTLQLGACLADDMGLGKTIQVLGVLNLCKLAGEAGTDLLVVPPTLLDNWCNEAQKFAPDLKIFVAYSSKTNTEDLKNLPAKTMAEFDLVITAYDTAMGLPWIKEFDWCNLILDEAQQIKDPRTKKSQFVKGLQSTWRLVLTGTPIENRLGDLWSLFDFLNPGLLGTSKEFKTFCRKLEKGEHGYAPLRKLVQPYILRRLKSDRKVITELPDKIERTVNCCLSKRQAALYQQSVNDLKKILEDTPPKERRGVVLNFLLRFKQICNHPSQWLGDGIYAPEESGKFQQLRELCEQIESTQEKVLVFSQYREISDQLVSFMNGIFGHEGLILHGGTTMKKRQQLVARFQADERIPFMVLSLKAAGYGITLTGASHVVHFDRWWNPSVEDQATDRAFRIGQTKNVLVHKFICKGTIEERIDKMIANKKQLSEKILPDKAKINLTRLGNQELISMVSLDMDSALLS